MSDIISILFSQKRKEACLKDKPLKDKINEEVVELPEAADSLALT